MLGFEGMFALPATSRRFALMTALVCIPVGGVMWFGFHAISEWRRISVQVADQRASQEADLLVEAITRDMRGVQMRGPYFPGLERVFVGIALRDEQRRGRRVRSLPLPRIILCVERRAKLVRLFQPIGSATRMVASAADRSAGVSSGDRGGSGISH